MFPRSIRHRLASWKSLGCNRLPHTLSIYPNSYYSSRSNCTNMVVNTTDRLQRLRALMKQNGADVYIAPSGDAHASEYIAACDGRREYVSGFDGSAGIAVIAPDAAALSTDGRYFNQASQQIDNNWTLLKEGLKDIPTWEEWAAEKAKGGKVVAVDPTLISAKDAKTLQALIQSRGGSKLLGLEQNLIDEVWGSGRPARPSQPVFVHPNDYAGQSVADKLVSLRADLARVNSMGIYITMLDEIAYLFNLRGSDIPFNPVFYSYAVVTPTSAALYVEKSKLDTAALAHLAESGVEVKSYDEFLSDAKAHYQSSTAGQRGTGRFHITSTGSWALQLALGGGNLVEEIKSPITFSKSVKNEIELAGFRACHIRDGAAISEYFAWLEDQLVNQKATLTEAEAADKLDECRRKRNLYKGQSFPTISSSGPNAAVMHYQPEHGKCSVIDPSKIYLCDSGAQYLDGTTDTTRTLHFGTPTEKEKEAYTAALKALISLHKAIFPQGVSGFALDVVARQHLWNKGWDYRHGTGHGVGSFLNVHEGPMGIGVRPHYVETPLVAGNVLSNEPGYYEDGSFGIRIENMMIVKQVETKYCFGDRSYLGFENLTMVPYSRKLMNLDDLTSEEKEWLNQANKLILQNIKPQFEGDALTLAWLERETQPY